MAVSSRGLYGILHQHSFRLPSSVRTAIFTARPPISLLQTRTRSFPFASLLRYQAPVRYFSRTSAHSFANADPILRTVIQTHQPVVLYSEPSRRRYLGLVYSWASIATGIGLYNFYWVQNLPSDLSFFVAPTYVFIGVAFLAIGIHIFQRPARRISALEVVPGSMGGRLQIRLRVRKTPWSRESIITADSWEATLSEKTHPLVEELVEADRARKQNITEGLEHMFFALRYWEIAARWLEQKWTSFFLKFKFAVLQFGIAEVEVDGVKWKLDCEGWLLEEGKGEPYHCSC
jgi:hypothetical protein